MQVNKIQLINHRTQRVFAVITLFIACTLCPAVYPRDLLCKFIRVGFILCSCLHTAWQNGTPFPHGS